MYGVESDINIMGIMPASLSDQVKEIEQSLLDLLITNIFDQCDGASGLRKLNIFEPGKKIKHFVPIASTATSPLVTSLGIIGIKSNPLDLANGSK
jgi:hypothetical protein